ncbi:hypothetical protein PM082_016266 [Marasmius tenuissimus]|nr:hypothetical protein PM082_016266 [Marasmius tenuissimus]
MMLTGFTMRTPEKAYTRTVRHETGHTLGFMHGHLRPEFVKRIDREKTLKEYSSVWDRKTIVNNILAPLWTADNSHYFTSEVADVHSIMCYPLEDTILKDDMKEPPITGGRDFSGYDKKHAAEVYPIPKYEARVISEDKETIGIVVVGRQLYLRLSAGEIRAIFEQTNGQLKTHNLGEVDDPFNTRLLGSGLLYRVEDGYKVSRWDGVTSGNIKEWTVINKKADNIQIDAHDGAVYFRDEAGMVVMYDKWRSRPWRQLHPGKDASWISSTKTHLFRQNKKGEIYKIPVPEGDPQSDWDRIDRFTDTVEIATNWNHLYQHRENGEIWVYTGAGRFWFRVFKQQGSKPFLIEASEDRLFRIETHDDDDGADVWVNDDNTEEGWKPLKIRKNFSFFVYTGGFVYEFVQETGRVMRYTGIC